MSAHYKGWWIRVCPDKTEVESILIESWIHGEDEKAAREWRHGDETEWDLPHGYAAKIKVKGTSRPHGRNSYFCVMYQNHCARHYDFDKDEMDEISQSETDDCAC